MNSLILPPTFPWKKKQVKIKIENGENPMAIKKLIAKNIVRQYHDETSAEDAEAFFMNQFQNKNFEKRLMNLFQSTIYPMSEIKDCC
jgi:tyrosyl-tRNA synthetase